MIFRVEVSALLITALRWVVRIAGGVIGLVLIALALLQADPLSTALVRFIAGVTAPPGLTISLARASGNLISGLTIDSLVVVRPGADTALVAEQVRGRYNLGGLLERALVVGELSVVRPVARLRLVDDQWSLLPPADTPPAANPWAIEIDRLAVEEGSVLLPVRADSIHRLSGVVLRGRDFRAGRGLAGIVDSLSATVVLAGHDDIPGTLLASGWWQSGRLQVDTLFLRTRASHVAGSGTLVLREPAGAAADTRFSLIADPLALDEVSAFFPLVGGPPVRVTIEARGDPSGELEVSVDGSTNGGGTVALDGALRLGPRGPRRISLGGTFEDLDPGDLLAKSATHGSIGGRLEVDLTGPTADSLSGTARLSLTPSSVGEIQIGATELRARLDQGLARVRLDGRIERFGIEAKGDVDPRAGVWRYDLAGTARSATAPAEAIQFSAVGSGLPPTATGRFELRADSVRLETGVVAQARLDGTLAGDSVSGRLHVALDSTAISARLAARPFEEEPWARLIDGRLTRLDLRSLGGARAPRSAINGRFTGSVVGFEPAVARGQLELELDSSRVGRQPIRTGRARLALDRGRAELTGRVTLPEGGLEVDAEAYPLARPVRYAIRDARFRELDLAAWLGRADWRTRLNGHASARGTGTDPTTLVAAGRVDLDPSAINAGAVRGELTWRAENGRVTGSTTLRAGGGAVEANGEVVVAAPLSYRLSARVDLPELGPLLGSDSIAATLAADVELAGRGTTRETLEGTLGLVVREGSWQGIQVDSGKAALAVTTGFLRADTLWLRSNVGTIDGAGGVPLRDESDRVADLMVQARVDNLDPLESSFGGRQLTLGAGDATVRVTGPASRLTLAGDGRADALAVGTARLVGMVANVTATMSWDEGVQDATGHAQLDQLSFPTGAITQTTLDARYTPSDDLIVEAQSRIDAKRTARLAARLDPSAPEAWWTVESSEVDSDGTHWTLAAPGRIRFRPTFAVDSLVLEAPGRRIAVDGELDLAGPSDFHVAVDSFPVETIADLAGFERLGGTVTGRFDLTGSGSERRGTGTLDFVVRGPEGEAGTLHVEASLRGDVLELNGGIDQQGAKTAVLVGSLPWPVRTASGPATGPMDLRLRADSFAVAFVQPFIEARLAQVQGGRISGEVRLTGSPGSPAVAGQLRLAGGRVLLPQYGVTYADAEGVVALESNLIRVERLSLRSGDGTLVATGQIRLEDLTQGELELELRADRFRAVRSDAIHAVASGTLTIRGTNMAPVISGEIQVERGDLYLDSGIAAGGQVEVVELTENDYAMLEKYFGFPVRRQRDPFIPTFEALTLDLTIRGGRDSWIRQRANPELAIQMTGQLRVRKQPGPAIDLLGELETVSERSYVEQFGRRFNVRRGQLTFRGGPLDTRFDLEAEYTVPSRTHNEPEAVIVLGMVGKVGDLKITLSSEPSMENADIVSYIATGRPASQALDIGGETVTAAGTSVALSQATGLVESVAGNQLGLDVVEIRRDGLEGTTLVAGRYVSPTLYLGFKQPISLREGGGGAEEGRDSQTEVEIELQAYRWLLLNLQSGGDALQFFLRARRGY